MEKTCKMLKEKVLNVKVTLISIVFEGNNPITEDNYISLYGPNTKTFN